MWQDVRFALRRVVRARGLSLTIVLILGVGIGTTTAMVSVVDALRFRPIAVPNPDSLVSVSSVNERGGALMTPLTAIDVLGRADLGVDGWCGCNGGAIEATDGGGRPMSAVIEFVSGSCLRVIGVSPALGRWIDERDAPVRGQGQPVAVITHGFWQRMFDGDPAVIGKTLRIQNGAVTVIGVMPAGFEGLRKDLVTDVIVPFNSYRTNSGAPSFVARLHDPRALEGLRARLVTLWPALLDEVMPPPAGGAPRAPLRADVQSLSTGFSLLRRLYAPTVTALALLAVLLLALTAVNVGALLVSKVSSRAAELAMMRTLGAGSRRITTQLVAEGAIYALAGGAIGVPLAFASATAFGGLFPMGLMPWTIALTPDVRVLAAVSIGAVALALLMSALPAWLALRDARGVIGDRTVTRAPSRWASAMLIVELAATVVVVFACGLLLRSFASLSGMERGFDADRLLSAHLAPSPAGYQAFNQSTYYPQLVERVAALPGVRQVAFARYFGTINAELPVQPVGFAGDADAPASGVMDFVSPGFFSTVGIPLIGGRDVAWSDGPERPRVAIVSESLARALAADGAVIGRSIRYGTDARYQRLEVIGVAGNVSLGNYRQNEVRLVYVPAIQANEATFATVHVRTDGEPLGLARPVSAIVESLGREHVQRAATIDDWFANSLVAERMGALVSSIAAGLALLLSCLGVYALVAADVTRRTREFGIRAAVGARPRDVSRLVVRQSATLIVAGLVLGIPVALAAAPLLRALLFGVTTVDAVTLAACAAAMMTVGVLATLLPMRRAMRVDPAVALRTD